MSLLVHLPTIPYPTSDKPIIDMLVWLVMDGMDEIISAMVWLQFVQ
jgi:hypothetical protein